MGIWGTVANAVRWLVKAVTGLSAHRGQIKSLVSVLDVNDKVTKRLEKFFSRLEKIETRYGHIADTHTDFWAKLSTGNRDGEPVTLTPAEVAYGFQFKKAFDKTIKPIGTKLLDRPDPAAAPVVPALELDDVADDADELDDDDD